MKDAKKQRPRISKHQGIEFGRQRTSVRSESGRQASSFLIRALRTEHRMYSLLMRPTLQCVVLLVLDVRMQDTSANTYAGNL